MFDQDGRFIHNTESSALVGADRSDRDYFIGVQKTKDLYIGTPIRSRTNDEVVLSLTRRIEFLNGDFAGGISAALPLRRQQAFFARFNLDPSIVLALGQTDGTLLVRLPPTESSAAAENAAGPIQQAILEGRKQGTIKGRSAIDGQTRIAAFRVLDRHPFVVMVAISEDGYLAEWRANRNAAIREWILMAAGLVVFSAILSIVFRRQSMERAEAERALQRALMEAGAANNAKTMFLANMSHELRTPLNAIIGFSEIISSEKLGPVGERRYVSYAHDILKSGSHLLDLINDILDITRIEAGKQSLSREAFAAADDIAECLRIIGASPASQNVRIVSDIPVDLPPLHADRRAFRQILLNLISNAVKFTNRNGRVIIAANARDGGIAVTVRDNGVGIPAEKLPLIGQPFMRIGDPLTARVGGTGLGLSISKALVELHGGRIRIDSVLGQGTSVEVWFPSDPASERPEFDP